MSKKVVIAGGSGAIGKALKNHFVSRLGTNTQFYVITRGQNKTVENTTFLNWDAVRKDGLPDADAVISLTGENIIQKSWTEKQKQALYDSRIGTTNLLIEKMQLNPPKRFVSASAVGIYPVNTKEDVSEFTELPDEVIVTYPQKLVRDWERAARGELVGVSHQPYTTTIIRIGFVIGPKQNGVKELLLPFKLGLGGRIGRGTQPFPWIDEEDLCEMFYQAAFGPCNGGVINGVHPHVPKQIEFAKTFASALYRPAWFPLPAFIVRLIFGERSQLILEGPKTVPEAYPQVIPDFQYSVSLEESVKKAVK